MVNSRGNQSRYWIEKSGHDVGRRFACIAAAITGDRSGAEDIVQQAAAIAIAKDQRFTGQEQFDAWMAGIVRHCALNARRKKIRRKTHSVDPTDLSGVANYENPENEKPAFSRQTGEICSLQRAFDDELKSALQSLSPEARTCLLLRTVENLSYKDISNLMSIPEGTAMNHVHRSKKRLRTILGEKNTQNKKEGGRDE